MDKDQSVDSSKLMPLLALILFTAAVYLAFLNSGGADWQEHIPFLVFWILSLIFQIWVLLTRNLSSYYVTVLLAVFFGGLAVLNTDYTIVKILVLMSLLVEIVFVEPYPLNLIISATVTTLILLLEMFLLRAENVPVGQNVNHLVLLAVPGYTVVVSGSLMLKYREIIVKVRSEHKRLKDSIINLTQTNTKYLDYAIVAKEEGTEKERLRITRDIHDIVGYTLTNNMMLMEAALDIMKENPLALPSIIETARMNAEEGLKEVRKTMYRFRSQKSDSPVGLNALVRLGRIFEKATSIKVQFNFGNSPSSFNESIDSALFHLIQEALVNAFKHGNGTEVHVSLWCDDHRLKLYVQDNGAGAQIINEGIGLKGMRERLVKLDGELEVKNVVDGFLVFVTIPWEKE